MSVQGKSGQGREEAGQSKRMFVGSTRISELCMCVYMGFIHYWRRCGVNVTVGKFSWRARPVVDCAVPPTPHRYLLRKKEKYATRKTCAAVEANRSRGR